MKHRQVLLGKSPLFTANRHMYLSLILCSTLFSGCAALGLSDSESKATTTKQPNETNAGKKASQVHTANKPAATPVTLAKAEESAVPAQQASQNTAAKVAKSTPTVPQPTTQPITISTPSFKEPKALQDMRAISTDLIWVKGRAYVPAPEAVVAAVAAAPTSTENKESSAEIKQVTASARQPTQPASPSIPKVVATTEVIPVATSDRSNAELTADQANRLIEDNPTAAGVETVALLDTPKEKKVAAVAAVLPKPAAPEKPTKVKTDLVAKAAGLQRPAAVGIWQIQENWDGQHPGACRLSTPTIQIDQQGYATQFSLDVVDGKLIVNTSTNLNISLQDVGVRFDNGSLEAFSNNYFATNAMWSGNLASALKKSDELNIILGGSELGKRRQQASINLNDLKQAYQWYLQCNK